MWKPAIGCDWQVFWSVWRIIIVSVSCLKKSRESVGSNIYTQEWTSLIEWSRPREIHMRKTCALPDITFVINMSEWESAKENEGLGLGIE